MDLYYEINGKGEPIVLLHSGGVDLRDWTFVTPLLSSDYQVISFDARGVGKSISPSKQVNYVDDLKSVLDYFEFKRATLVGHSIGGQIATDFTLEYPERVAKLVLIAPALSGFDYSKDFKDYIQSINEAAPDVDKMMELSLRSPSYRVIKASPRQDLWMEMHRDYFERMLGWPAFEMLWPQQPAIQRLEELTVKTLLLIGDEELPDNQRVAECFRQVPAVRVVEIAGADHMVTLTHPEKLTRIITDFMEDDSYNATNTGRK